MHAARAAEGEHDEIARVAAAVGGHGLHGAHHVGVGDEVDAVGRLDEIAAERRCNLVGDGAACGVEHRWARCRRRAPRVEIAQHDVGVGDGRLPAAAAVAGGARVGAGALGADLEGAARSRRARSLPPPAPDLRHVDDRQLQRVAGAAHQRARRRHGAADLVLLRTLRGARARSARPWRSCRPCRR